MSDTATASKPAIKDMKGTDLERLQKVFYDIDGSEKSSGHITGIEYQRQRVVIQPADPKADKVVRPASRVRVEKNKSGKIQVVAKAVRAGKNATAKANA